MGEAVFFAFAAVALLSALMVIVAGSVVHSALYLVLSFLAVAGLFILQGAEFIGAVQILLYAGSIVVMFVFVVMMVNLKEVLGPQWAALRSIGGFVIGGAVLFQLLFIAVGTGSRLEGAGSGLAAADVEGAGHIQAFGNAIFREHLLSFEILSLVLLAALFGLIVIGRRK